MIDITKIQAKIFCSSGEKSIFGIPFFVNVWTEANPLSPVCNEAFFLVLMVKIRIRHFVTKCAE